jgi:aminopeptidase N
MMSRFRYWLPAVAVGVQLGAWHEAVIAQPARAASAGLTFAEARSRAARVSDVAYALELRLDGEAPEYSGRVSATFELTDAERDLALDFAGGAVQTLEVNGRTVDGHYNGFFLTLPAAALHKGDNRVEVEFSHPYSTDGSGLYRFRDPEDGRDYLYTDFEPYDQNRLFPSFDQPDLKARFATRVSVPADWQVISNVRESQVIDAGAKRTWIFGESPPISTYLYALHAGEYHQWSAEVGDIPLRLFARESLARYVNAGEWFQFTRQGFELYEDYFRVPYAFDKYDQVIVPHFNSGAMENVAAVTFNESYLRRGAMTREDRRDIASTLLHEMAHMWFGDLVTMRWWNGLWLNESFAPFMATLAMAGNTEFKEAWHLAYLDTVAAYRADERDTTHAIELPVPDTNAAFANFDPITYEKGQAVLAQLNHLVGPEAFREGVSRYLKTHAYGNTDIDDFLGPIAKASDRDLEDWAMDWLHEPGTNAVRIELACEAGMIRLMTLLQDAPNAWPTLRTHRTQIGLYDFDARQVSVRVLPSTYAGPRTEIVAAKGLPCPDFVYANHGNWDYARVQLDPSMLPRLSANLGSLSDPLARSMLWQSVWDMVLDARLRVPDYIEFALAKLPGETDNAVMRQVLDALYSALRYLVRLDPDGAHLAQLGPRVEANFWQDFSTSSTSDRRFLMFDGYVDTVTSAAGGARLAGILAGSTPLPGGFSLDQDRRWDVLQKLAELDHPDVDRLLALETDRDASELGRLRAVAVDAARPDADRKRHWVDMLFTGDNMPVTPIEFRAAASALFPARQSELQWRFADRVLNGLDFINEQRDAGFFRPVMNGVLGIVCRRQYLDALDARIADSESLHPTLRRGLRDLRFEVARCLAIGARLGDG